MNLLGLCAAHEKLAAPRVRFDLSVVLFLLVLGISGCDAGGELGPPPQAPAVTAQAGDRSVRLEWPPVEGAGMYLLYWYDSDGAAASALQPIRAASSPETIDGLDNGVTYHLAITAVGSGGESPHSSTVAFTPQPPPGAPQLTATASGDGSVSIQWEAVPLAQAYHIYRLRGRELAVADAASAPGFEGLTPVVDPIYQQDGLDNGVEYTFIITAVNASGESAGVSTQVTPGPVRQLTSGNNHSCTVDSENTAWCWGDNFAGQSGELGPLMFPKPTAIAGVSGWRMIAAGEQHTCGVSLDEALICWGGSSGMRIIADAPPRSRPTQETIRWRSIAVGGDDGCGVQSDGALWCWYLGVTNDETPARAGLSRVGAASDWLDAAVNNDHGCARKLDRTMHCWGANSVGQLGVGTTDNSLGPIPVDGGRRYGSVSVGPSYVAEGTEHHQQQSHSCAIDDAGSLWCWGSNRYGQLGNAQTRDGTVPQAVLAPAPWTDVAVGATHTCGVQSDGSLWCWGNNEFGQLGLVERIDQPKPARIGEDTDWRRVVAGAAHTCGLKSNGSIWCVGRNEYGQLGEQASAVPAEPVQVLDTVVDFAVGDASACAVRADRSTWCWGGIALPDSVDPSRAYAPHQRPVKIETMPVHDKLFPNVPSSELCALLPGNRFKCGVWADLAQAETLSLPLAARKVEFGNAMSCVWAVAGTLHCSFDYLGSPADAASTITPIMPDTSWSATSMGTYFMCAVTTSRELWCFGQDSGGVLAASGISIPEQIRQPVRLFPDQNWTEVASGDVHACAIDESGALYCWGQGENGQLGIDSDTNYDDLPLPVAEEGPWAIVRAGREVTCGIKSDGSLWCWGQHSVSKVHPIVRWASLQPVRRPLRVGGSNGWVDIGFGAGFGCGLKTDATLHCWGLNDVGQLGDGSAWRTQWSPVTFSAP